MNRNTVCTNFPKHLELGVVLCVALTFKVRPYRPFIDFTKLLTKLPTRLSNDNSKPKF